MKTNKMKNRAADGLFIGPAADAVAPVEPEDLSRFEGEGGLEALVPAMELIDVPLENAIGGARPGRHIKRIERKRLCETEHLSH